MFERFTTEAREVVIGATEEARVLGHGWIGTEHLVIAGAGAAGLDAAELRAAIARAGWEDIDGEALATLGIDLGSVRERVEATFGRGALAPRPRRRWRPGEGCVPFSARAKQALELAMREAVAQGDRAIRAEHVLLGVLRGGEGHGARLLADRGVTVELLRGRDAA